MTEAQYNKLKPHSVFIKAMIDCMEKCTPLPDISHNIAKVMIDISEQTGGRPVDRSCGDCVTNAIKDTLRKYREYENTTR